MKSKTLSIKKPCSESWESMTASEQGRFCDQCSKSVIDFTQMSGLEISKEVKKAKGNLCARVTKEQLRTPVLDFQRQREFDFPYSNIAAGLMIATAISAAQPVLAAPKEIHPTEISQFVSSPTWSTSPIQSSKAESPIEIETTLFKGKVTAEENGEPVENAKVTFFTSNTFVSTHTESDGTFCLTIPSDLIDADNVIRVTFGDIKGPENDDNNFYGYESSDLVLTKGDINSFYEIKAQPLIFLLGDIDFGNSNKTPIVLKNGKEIDYKTFIKAQRNESTSCQTEYSGYHYFDARAAVAIYGKKASGGLYVFYMD